MHREKKKRSRLTRGLANDGRDLFGNVKPLLFPSDNFFEWKFMEISKVNFVENYKVK